MNLKKLILLGSVGLISAAAGVAVPQMMSGQSHDAVHATKAAAGHDGDADHAKKEKEEKPAAKADSHDSGGHGGDAKGKAEQTIEFPGPQFVPFGNNIVLNLNETNLTKYLSVEITLQVDKEDKGYVIAAVEARRPKLRKWLISHLAGKKVDDIQGTVGVNRLCREIQDKFNELLFDDGRERIREILFEEFHVN